MAYRVKGAAVLSSSSAQYQQCSSVAAVLSDNNDSKSHVCTAIPAFEYDRAGTVLALAIQYSRRHVRKELRGKSFHVLESSQVLIPSACLKTTLFTFSEYNHLLFIR